MASRIPLFLICATVPLAKNTDGCRRPMLPGAREIAAAHAVFFSDKQRYISMIPCAAEDSLDVRVAAVAA
jgi:hypothetical protein